MLTNALILALREIRRNVLRSSLTVLGIVIGVGAVITMVTLGSGATAQVTSEISSLGSNLLVVMPGQRMGPGGASGSARAFRPDDADALMREVPSLAAVAPVASQSISVIAGNRNWSTTVNGTTNGYLDAGGWELAQGRRFTESEMRSGSAVCMLGATVKRELFGSQTAVGATVRLERISCEVVAVLGSKGQSSMGADRDDLVLVPLRMLHRRVVGNDDVRQIMVSVDDGASTTMAQAAIERLLRERRRIGPADEDDFSVMDMQDVVSTVTGTTRVLTALLGAVAAVSLLVGGIGIMNIMLVSVTERTREIGIRLAIGALEREVLTQFLVEAVVLSSFGGLIGISLALGGSALAARALLVPFVLDLRIVALAFVFSASVGVMIGYVPARRAARLNPIDALRHE